MRHDLFHIAAAAAATALSLTACDLTSLQKKDSETQQPATEATVVGIWRTNIPTGKTPPEPTDIKVTMDVEKDHTMLLSQRIATGLADPQFVEIVKEYWSWTVEDGKMKSTKVSCTYKDPQTMKETSTTCVEPLSKEAEINVKGSAWTVVEQGQPIVFRKE